MYATNFYNIYSYPSKIINKIKEFTLKKYDALEYNTPFVRVINIEFKNKKILLKIQIINSRASYTSYLSNIITDYDFIKTCAPFSLLQIGYFSKIEEVKRLLNLKNLNNKKLGLLLKLISKIKKTSGNNINAADYYYTFIEGYIMDTAIIIKLSITQIETIFNVPFLDLINDKSLMENIYPPDLLRIGYELCHLEIKENLQPIFKI